MAIALIVSLTIAPYVLLALAALLPGDDKSEGGY